MDQGKISTSEAGLSPFRKSQMNWQREFCLDGRSYSANDVVQALEPLLTADRIVRLREVIAGRTRNFIPVLENIYDLGNISAVMRSAEAFGFLEMHLIKAPGSRFKVANRVTKGAEKWLDVGIFNSAEESVLSLKNRGFAVWATHLEASRPISEIDFSRPTAVVLGNEKDGVSPEMLDLCDGRIVIPMQGFSQSFNISVAAALTFYHAWNYRCSHSGNSGDLSEEEKSQLYANYLLRCFDRPEVIMGGRAGL